MAKITGPLFSEAAHGKIAQNLIYSQIRSTMGILIKDEEFLQYANAIIEQATKKILISTFKLEITGTPKGRKLKEFFDKLVEKNSQNVDVEILFNWHDDGKSVPKTNWPAAKYLQAAGIETRFLKNDRCCHAKLIVVDGEKAIIGSHNFSVRSTQNNFELSYLSLDPQIAKQAGELFQRLFDAAKPV